MSASKIWFTIINIIILTLIPIHMINFVFNHMPVSLDKLINLHPLIPMCIPIFWLLIIHLPLLPSTFSISIFTFIPMVKIGIIYIMSILYFLITIILIGFSIAICAIILTLFLFFVSWSVGMVRVQDMLTQLYPPPLQRVMVQFLITCIVAVISLDFVQYVFDFGAGQVICLLVFRWDAEV